MAPKKSTKKPAPQKPAVKAIVKPAAKTAVKVAPAKAPTVKPAAKMTVWPAETHAHEHHHHHGDCCGHGHGKSLLACLSECCPLGKMLLTRSFWAASVVAFIVIFATDWLLHTRFLMADYAAASAFWRTDGEIRHGLIFITQAVTSLAYAAIVIGMGHAKRWWGSFVSGALAGVPVAMCAMAAYIMLPFASPYIPTVWGIASVLQGAVVGLAICAALKASRAPEDCEHCAPKPTIH